MPHYAFLYWLRHKSHGRTMRGSPLNAFVWGLCSPLYATSPPHHALPSLTLKRPLVTALLHSNLIRQIYSLQQEDVIHLSSPI